MVWGQRCKEGRIRDKKSLELCKNPWDNEKPGIFGLATWAQCYEISPLKHPSLSRIHTPLTKQGRNFQKFLPTRCDFVQKFQSLKPFQDRKFRKITSFSLF
jgi:hypothetical protein